MGTLLRQVARGGGIAPLERAGLTYSQIANLISEARTVGFLELESMSLTHAGESFVERFRLRRGKAGAKGWIAPAVDYRTDRLPIDSVFIPHSAPGKGLHDVD